MIFTTLPDFFKYTTKTTARKAILKVLYYYSTFRIELQQKSSSSFRSSVHRSTITVYTYTQL